MKPNHPYTITFPIWKCDSWSALRGRLKLTDEQVVIARWNDTSYLDEELAILDQQHRIKPFAETKAVKPQAVLLPSILQIVRTNTYTDVLIDNCSQWHLLSGDLSKLLLIYYGYDQYTGCPPRDCTIENIIKNGDSIVILDFGIKKRLENYCVYWNPLILKGRPCHSSYQWSLGILYLVMTQGVYILNEVQKHISQWLKGGRLDVGSLNSSKKPSIQNLISSLLNPENPIPWNQIPHHPAFREDSQCKQVLKDFQIRYNRMEIKCRSSSRISSRDDSSNQISIMPQPYGLKNPQVTTQGFMNQSLITKVSNMYKVHQEKVRSAIGSKYSSVQSRASSSSKGRPILQVTQSSKFNNFFSTTKLQPKGPLNQINNSNGGKSFRNQTQNTAVQTGQDSYRKSCDNSSEVPYSQTIVKQDIFYEKIRSRIASVKGSPTLQQTKSRQGSKNFDQEKKRSSQIKEEIDQLNQQSENAIEQYKTIYSSDLELGQFEKKEKEDSHISQAENYIQLIKRSSSQLNVFSQKYNKALDAINIVGETVAKCLTFFNGLTNFWVIPLFLVFKRMLQIRYQIEYFLEQKVNTYEIDDWLEVSTSKEYESYLNKVKQDNQLVQNELTLLLNSALAKAEKLDKTRKDKVEWFLNDNINDNIKDVCFTYFHGQIYKNIKDKKGIAKPTLEWLKLQIQAQAALIIIDLPVLTYEKDKFTYQKYLEALEYTDEQQIHQYLKKNEQYLERK